MAEIETYQDSTPMGTFSQIRLDDGSKVLVSVTPTDIAIFKVGFFGTPKETLWQEDVHRFLNILHTADNSLIDKSPLELAVKAVISCKSISDIPEKFNGLKRLQSINSEMEELQERKDELNTEREANIERGNDLVDKIGGLVDEMSEKMSELEEWQMKLKAVIDLLMGMIDDAQTSKRELLREFMEENSTLNGDQEKEILILTIMEMVWSIYSVFTEAEAKDIIEELKNNVLKKYFDSPEERVAFEKLFWERWDEYAQVLDPENENIVIQIGGIFFDHLIGSRVDAGVMALGAAGMNFLAVSKQIRYSLKELND